MAKKKKQQDIESVDYSTYSVGAQKDEENSNAVKTLDADSTNSNKKVLHKRSSTINDDGTPKLPTADQIDYGELAINYGEDGEILSIKNSDGDVIPFIPLKAFLNAPIVTNPDFSLAVNDGEIYRAGEPIKYSITSSDASSTVVIDDENVVIEPNETIEGKCYTIEFPIGTDNLKSVYIDGDFEGNLSPQDGSNSEENNTLETVELKFSKKFERSFEQFCHGFDALKSVKISGSKPTNLHRMFAECLYVEDIDINGINTENVTDMYRLFQYCTNLKALDLSKWKTSNVTTMEQTFAYLYKLTSIDISGFDTSNCTAMNGMFRDNDIIETLDLSSFNTSNVTAFNAMFRQCYALKNLYLGNNWDMAKATNISNMFMDCSALTNVTGTISNIMLDFDLSYSPLTRESALVFINGLYDYSGGTAHTITFSSTTLDLLTDDDIKIATDKNWSIPIPYIFDLSLISSSNRNVATQLGWQYANGANAKYPFNLNGTVYNANITNYWINATTDHNFYITADKEIGDEYVFYANPINNHANVATASVFTNFPMVNFAYTFNNCRNLTSIESGVINITNLAFTFNCAVNMTNFDGIANWNTSGVTSLSNTFNNCSNITTLDGIANWDVSNVTTLFYAFANCRNLTSLEGLANWDVSNVTNIRQAFNYCTSLTNLEGLGNWNITNLQELNFTFAYCNHLTSLDGIANWNTSNLTNLYTTFYDCSNLETLDGIANWDTSNITDMRDCFYYCSNINDISAMNNWPSTMNANFVNAFRNCTNLQGNVAFSFNITCAANMFNGRENSPLLNVYASTSTNAYNALYHAMGNATHNALWEIELYEL